MFHGEKVLHRKREESVDVTLFFRPLVTEDEELMQNMERETNSSILLLSVECVHVSLLTMTASQACYSAVPLYVE
jgi:hypothetical protein